MACEQTIQEGRVGFFYPKKAVHVEENEEVQFFKEIKNYPRLIEEKSAVSI
jgi:hypothetical protein